MMSSTDILSSHNITRVSPQNLSRQLRSGRQSRWLIAASDESRIIPHEDSPTSTATDSPANFCERATIETLWYDKRSNILGVMLRLEKYSTRPIDIATRPPVELFHWLVSKWNRETGHLSSLTERYAHWAYQKIIGMGKPVVPLLLKELEANPDYWFFALQEITGENPVSQESRGKLGEIASAWLQWAKNNGFSW